MQTGCAAFGAPPDEKRRPAGRRAMVDWNTVGQPGRRRERASVRVVHDGQGDAGLRLAAPAGRYRSAAASESGRRNRLTTAAAAAAAAAGINGSGRPAGRTNDINTNIHRITAVPPSQHCRGRALARRHAPRQTRSIGRPSHSARRRPILEVFAASSGPTSTLMTAHGRTNGAGNKT